MKKPVTLYHRILRRETFEQAAKDLFNLLKSTQINFPGNPRILYVDIDGHRNKNGGYDIDMLQLQIEFGIDFLGKYFTEIHFPIIEFQNSSNQRDDIPDTLNIFSSKNFSDNSLNKLYIENYRNTEFISEPDIYNYLERVHSFLIDFREFETNYTIEKNDFSRTTDWMNRWKKHISDLINELYTVFLYGNLLSAAAMTRTLIECFVYFSILSKEGNEFLIHEWYLCSICYSSKNDKDFAKTQVKEYCQHNNLDFNEKWTTYKETSRDKWLRSILPTGKLNFQVVCNYLDDSHIYKDFESACAFVHGQDMASKSIPFAFYNSVSHRFHMMMDYIYKTIRLFPLNSDLEKQLISLSDDLPDLIKKYNK